jgi:hypothetical protein
MRCFFAIARRLNCWHRKLRLGKQPYDMLGGSLTNSTAVPSRSFAAGSRQSALRYWFLESSAGRTQSLVILGSGVPHREIFPVTVSSSKMIGT